MSEYSKMKNADLEALLKTRGLPTGGKKADMVDRLTKDDETKKAAETKTGDAPAASDKVAVLHPEDEIDWDDDASDTVAEPAKPAAAAVTAAETTTEPAEATIKAGGQGQVPNPQALPNLKTGIDPSKTSDLTVKAAPEDGKEDSSDAAPAEKEKTSVDFAKGLAATSLDAEIEKRKARAKRFGLNIENDEGLKKLERQKKGGDFGPPKGLDDSLPERNRKRGREARDDNEDGGRNKRRGGGRFAGRRGRGNRDGDNRRDNRNEGRNENRTQGRTEDKSKQAGREGGPGSEEWARKLEARKNRFATAST
ncbi:hypothetical protein BCR34DRAFT_593235 [Clohesyomyces aquaticus]|uniref:SAP domain-containing protein n=1 Tax=Clohesyomyces aquaticus TaxID=1231657 RepID=A0A1Y1YKE8_9PLEO|nr:hypothetical protein BCR34DRAFT_593235 [Clohesyomyces aquaticus]